MPEVNHPEDVQPKHTPGPWKVSERLFAPLKDTDIFQLVQHEISGTSTEGRYGDRFSISGGCSVATATTVVATPDLFDALANLVRVVRGCELDDAQREAITQARAALSKALGDTQ